MHRKPAQRLGVANNVAGIGCPSLSYLDMNEAVKGFIAVPYPSKLNAQSVLVGTAGLT